MRAFYQGADNKFRVNPCTRCTNLTWTSFDKQISVLRHPWVRITEIKRWSSSDIFSVHRSGGFCESIFTRFCELVVWYADLSTFFCQPKVIQGNGYLNRSLIVFWWSWVWRWLVLYVLFVFIHSEKFCFSGCDDLRWFNFWKLL